MDRYVTRQKRPPSKVLVLSTSSSTPYPYLDRFLVHSEEFSDAIGELERGRKESHFMWFVFPQLRGLGFSPMAHKYGLQGVGEAEAFLSNHGTRNQLVQGFRAVLKHHHGRQSGGLTLVDILQSSVDARKLVSCVTLFEGVTKQQGGEQNEEVHQLARTLLTWAIEEELHPPCRFTQTKLDQWYRRQQPAPAAAAAPAASKQ